MSEARPQVWAGRVVYNRSLSLDRRSGVKRISEHGQTALGLFLSRLVLNNVPVLGEQAILHPNDVGDDPGNGETTTGEATVHQDPVAVNDDGRGSRT